MRTMLGVLALASAGCVMVKNDAVAQPAESAARCNAGPAQRLIGQPRNRATDNAARQYSGAVQVRWIPFGAFVTQDYREDRLNLRLNRSERIESASCG